MNIIMILLKLLAEMNFYLDFPNVNVFAMSRVDNIPHIKLSIDRMRLKWLKD